MSIFKFVPSHSRFLFLVGAGISMEAPSNLPSARSFTNNLLNLCTSPDYTHYFLKMENLRYEHLISQLQRDIDSNLKFLDYFDLEIEPNFIHNICAHFIMAGHDVITTNFDYLIEQALIRLIPSEKRDKIIPIITKTQFRQYQQNQILHDQGYLPIYKIHGSKKNIITGELTSQSLVTTMEALGRDREKDETFAIESYKKPTVLDLAHDRFLIVMGYSGSDDFDIGPTLFELNMLNGIMWIEHDSRDCITVNKITSTIVYETKVEQLLQALTTRFEIPIYIVQGHTKQIVKLLYEQIMENYKGKIDFPFDIPQESKLNLLEFNQWVKHVYENISLLQKFIFTTDLFYSLNAYDLTLECAKKTLQIAENEKNAYQKSQLFNLIGLILQNQGNLSESLEYLEESKKQIREIQRTGIRLSSIPSIGGIIANLGWVYFRLGRYDQALSNYEEALEIVERMSDFGKPIVGVILNNMGELHRYKKNYDLAIEYYERALKFYQELGNLTEKATTLGNIGLVYKLQKKYDIAREKYEEALRIEELLFDESGIATRLNNLGTLFLEQNEPQKAVEFIEKAANLAEKLGKIPSQATYLNNLAAVFSTLNQLEKAIQYGKDAIKLQRTIETTSSLMVALDNVGEWLLQLKKYAEAKEFLEESLKLHEKFPDEGRKYATLIRLANIAHYTNNISDKQTYLSQIVEIDRRRGDLESINEHQITLAQSHAQQQEYQRALELYEELIPVIRQIHPVDDLLDYYQKLGSFALQAQMFSKAKQFYSSLLEKALEFQNYPKQAVGYWNLGRFASNEGDLQTAFDYLAKSRKITQDLGDLEFQAQILAGEGMLLSSIGEIDHAISSLKKSKDIFHQIQKEEDERQVITFIDELEKKKINS
jgi:tetratricopeptide (TPR) repeat protein